MFKALVFIFSRNQGTIGFDYFNEYIEKRDLENFIVSCMEQYGYSSDELVNCLNDNSFSNP